MDFSGNIAIPTGGTVEAISLAIAISGEPVLSSQIKNTQYWDKKVEYYNTVLDKMRGGYSHRNRAIVPASLKTAKERCSPHWKNIWTNLQQK